jgi:hypothetical protein
MDVARRLDMQPKELEKHVDFILTGRPPGPKILKMHFPFYPNEGYAFLLGLWCAVGGIRLRRRDQTLRLGVEPAVADYLQSRDFSTLIGERPFVKLQILARLAGKVWQRKVVEAHYSRAILFLAMRLLGWQPPSRGIRSGRGRFLDINSLYRKIPSWIAINARFTHAFVEGYLNGRVQLFREPYGADKFSGTNVSIRVKGVNDEEVKAFTQFIGTHLQSFGIKGGVHPMPYRGPRRQSMYRFDITGKDSVAKLSANFNLHRAKTALFIRAQLDMDPVWQMVLQQCDTKLCYMISAIRYHGPISEPELKRIVRLNPWQFERTLTRLRVLGVLDVRAGYKYDPAVFVQRNQTVLQSLIAENNQRLSKIATAIPAGRVLRSQIAVPICIENSRLKKRLNILSVPAH